MELNTYFDRAQAIFENSLASATQFVRRTVEIDGTVIKFRFANPDLIPCFFPAIEHLSTDLASKAELTVCVWDSRDGRSKPPYPSWKSQRNYNYVDLLTSDNVRICCEIEPQRLTAIDFDKRVALFWIASAEQFPWYEQCRPFRTIFHWWGMRRGLHLVHGGAVGTEHGAALLVGPGGAGKSTSAVACLDSGMKYLADDHCMVAQDDSGARVLGLYSTAKYNLLDNIARFPRLEPYIVNKDRLESEKAMLFLRDGFADSVKKELPLKVILIPRISGLPRTTVSAARWSDASRALIPSTMSELRGSEVDDFYAMLKLAKTIPCFFLDAGTDMQHLAHTISDLIAKLEMGAAVGAPRIEAPQLGHAFQTAQAAYP